MSSNLKTPKSHDKELNTTKWGIIGAIGAAVAASVCCVVPLVLVFLGIGGAWAGSLSAFEPFRPYLMILTAILLGFAFYRVYRHPAESAICEPGSACAKPGTDKRNKMFLWFATVGAVLLLGFPYAAPAIFAVHEDVSTVQQLEVANFDVTGMTCNSCTFTVEKSLTSLDGVESADVTLAPPSASIQYDPSKVSIEDMIEATGRVGYTTVETTPEK